MLAACVAVFNLANGQLTMVFYARGLPQLHRRSVMITAIVVSVLVYPASKWLGLAGGQLACLTAIVAGYLFQIARTSHLTGLKSSEYAKACLLPALVSLSVVAFCLATRRFASLAQPVPNTIIGVAGCVLAYTFCLVVLFRKNQKIRVGL
jgi:hypothetical protein